MTGSVPLTVSENPVTQRFLTWWADKPAARLRDVAVDAQVPLCFQGQYLTRPGLLEAYQRRDVTVDVRALLELMFTLPSRLFGGDLVAMARAVGLTPVQADAIVRTAAGPPVRLARADLMQDGEAFQVIEFNVSSALGGWDLGVLTDVVLRDTDLAAFVDEQGLAYVDPIVGIADLVHAACEGADCPSRPVVAVVDWPSSYLTLEPHVRLMAGRLARFGFETVACHVGQLETRDGHLYVEGRHVDVVYRLVQVGDLLDGPDAAAAVEPILVAAETGAVRLFVPFSAGLFSSKGCLTLLQQDEHLAALTTAERELVDRVLPWTRTVRKGETAVGTERVDLVDYVLANRSALVLKPALLSSGVGVVTGWDTDQREWADAVGAALDGGYIVQRRVGPVAERFPDDRTPTGTRPLVLNWGVFVVGQGYGGAFVRALRDDDQGGVIAIRSGAGAACCFHLPD
jgi:hypothetical protein